MFARILVAGLLGTISTAASAQDSLAIYAVPARLIDLGDGRRINLDCRGHGEPAVLLEAGWGDTTLMWTGIHDALAERTATCAYDRAGLGFSDARADQIDLASIEADLAEIVKFISHDGPVLLVGHSKGGVFARQFAAAHPDKVAGLVLLDPGGPEKDQGYAQADPEGSRAAGVQLLAMLDDCVAQARSGALRTSPDDHPFCVARPDPDWSVGLQQADRTMRTSTAYAEARLAEFRINGDDLSSQAVDPHALGDVPVTVLSSDEGLNPAIPAEVRTRLIAARHAADASVAALYRRGVHRVVPGSGHMISDDQPEAVIDAVDEMLRVSRSGRPIE